MADDLEARVARLETAEAARQLVAAYADAVDAEDLEALRALFAPNFVLDVPGLRLEGADAAVGFFRERWAVEPGPRRHFVTNVRIADATADGATGTASFLYTGVAGPASILGWGRYRHRFGRVGSGLVLVEKVIRVEYQGAVSEGWAATLAARALAPARREEEGRP